MAEPTEAWIVERDGRDVARLTQPRVSDMLWTRYRLEPLDGSDAEAMATSDYWETGRLRVRAADGGRVEERVVVRPAREPGWVNVRTSVGEGRTGRQRRGERPGGLRGLAGRAWRRLTRRLRQG